MERRAFVKSGALALGDNGIEPELSPSDGIRHAATQHSKG